ncbi:MAG: hypothetical protein IJU87_08540 [Lachnospiraceae bacterium]|nr:hypothetical protein [Lachnospiraceae bacterium]
MRKMKKRMMQWVALVLTLSLLLPVIAFALPSDGSEDALVQESTDGSGGDDSGHVFRIRHPDKPVTPEIIWGGSAGGSGIQGVTAGKTLPIVTIVVSFNNIGYDTRFGWHERFFGDKDSLQDYYSVMSGGKFTWVPAEEDCSTDVLPEKDTVSEKFDRKNDGIIHVTVEGAHREWGDTDNDDKMDTIFQSLIAALEKADKYIDFSKYDRNNNKEIENNELGVGFILAGYEAAGASKGTKFYDKHKNMMLWSHQNEMYYKDDSEGYFDGVRIASFIAVPDRKVVERDKESDGDENVEEEDLGTIYHELGHYLGLPDLYDTKSLESKDPEKAVWKGYDSEFLSLMNSGCDAWDLDYKSRPSAFDAWSRAFLKWTEPEIATEDGEYTLYSQESGKYNILKIPTERENEYYLLENRRTEGIDIGLKTYETKLGEGRIASSNGLVLWHIDDDVYNKHKSDNKVNSTDHRLGVVPLFAESLRNSNDTFTLDFTGSKPYAKEGENNGCLPFYSKSNFEAIFRDTEHSEEGLFLPLYGEGDKADDPDSRILSSIRLEFIDDDSQEMKVRISGLSGNNDDERFNSGEPLSKIISEKELSVLNDPSASALSKNRILSKMDLAIENRVKGKTLISFNSAIRGNNTAREYWVRMIRNRALRYDGRKHLVTGSESGGTKNADVEIRIFYCEKEGKYEFDAPSDNTIASANGDWKEAKVKKVKLNNSNKATFDYTGSRNEGIKGYRGSAYISKIVLEDSDLNRTLGKGLNRILKAYSKKLKSDKSSMYTDADLEDSADSPEMQFIIPVYPLFLGIDSDYGEYTDGRGDMNKYSLEKGSLDTAGKKLSGARVIIEYGKGNSKRIKLRFSRKKHKDFATEIMDVTDQQGASVRQLIAEGNYFGYLEY